MKEIIANGWKQENGFKICYLQALEQHMQRSFPGMDLKATPHINSKVHVWRKNYSSLISMLAKSGIGWNDSTKMIEASDEVWEGYVKVDSNACLICFETWPLYKDLVEIFGQDRAIGEHAEDFIEVVDKVISGA